jgi:hypothetical protein
VLAAAVAAAGIAAGVVAAAGPPEGAESDSDAGDDNAMGSGSCSDEGEDGDEDDEGAAGATRGAAGGVSWAPLGAPVINPPRESGVNAADRGAGRKEDAEEEAGVYGSGGGTQGDQAAPLPGDGENSSAGDGVCAASSNPIPPSGVCTSGSSKGPRVSKRAAAKQAKALAAAATGTADAAGSAAAGVSKSGGLLEFERILDDFVVRAQPVLPCAPVYST